MKNAPSPAIAASLALGAVIFATLIAYAPGLSGGLHFDDYANLSALGRISDTYDLVLFASSGNAGPLGRPIALLSFAAQHHAWPNNPDDFLYVNVSIHLLNSCLVAWFVYLLCKARNIQEGQSAWIAIAATAIWSSSPILASSSLFIIQRMTTLTGTFILATLIYYLKARSKIEQSPTSTIIKLSIALVVGTTLSALSKENGLLLPTLILVIESTLLSRPGVQHSQLWHTWKLTFLALPTAAIILYLSFRAPYTDATLITRDFDLTDRLLSQAEILWRYALLAFLPQPENLGPFHDTWNRHIPYFYTRAAIATSLWILAICTAYRIRKNHPIALFAIVWFLAGHLIESTTIPLELYFEHRNYIPLIGSAIAIPYTLITSVSSLRSDQKFMLLLAYSIALYASLYNQTTTWGAPRVAAEMWHINKPNSVRSLLFLTFHLDQEGDPGTAERVVDEFIKNNPHHQQGHILKMIYLCKRNALHDNYIPNHNFVPVGSPIGFSTWAAQAFERIYQLRESGYCEGITDTNLIDFGKRLLSVPEIYQSGIGRHNILALMSAIEINRHEFTNANQYIDEALAARFHLDTLEVALLVSKATGDHHRMTNLLSAARSRSPSHPVRSIEWNRQLRRLELLAHSTP